MSLWSSVARQSVVRGRAKMGEAYMTGERRIGSRRLSGAGRSTVHTIAIRSSHAAMVRYLEAASLARLVPRLFPSDGDGGLGSPTP